MFPFRGEKRRRNVGSIESICQSFFGLIIQMIFLSLWTYLVVQLVNQSNVRQNSNEKEMWKSSLEKEKDSLGNLSQMNKTMENLLMKEFLEIEKKKKCPLRVPLFHQIEYNNIYWQQFQSSNGTFYFYNSFFDQRKSSEGFSSVRILSMIDRLNPSRLNLSCLIWYENESTPIISSSLTYHYMWYSKWGNYYDGILQPFLISCPIKSKTSLIPQSVSIIEDRCLPITTNLPIQFNPLEKGKEKKESFAVCVKGLEFPHDDLSLRLIEWIELLKILGVQQIFFYEFDLHPNLKKVIQFYEEKKFVQLKSFTLPGSQPNLLSIREHYLKTRVVYRRQNELIPYNDCFYQNIYRYDFIILLDIDEIILPTGFSNWFQMIKALEKSLEERNESYVAYSARNVYFFDQEFNRTLFENQFQFDSNSIGNISKYFHMLKNVLRSSTYNKVGSYVKTFFRTDSLLTLHNHFPLACLSRCRRLDMNISFGHLQHYRSDCVKELKKSCDSQFRANLTLDTTIFKYQSQLIEQSYQTIKQLNFT